MEEIGTVVEEKGTRVTVTFERKDACASCRMCAFTPNQSTVQVTAENVLQAKVGDRVLISMTAGLVLYAAMIAYALPLLFAGIGLFIGLLFQNELLQFALCLGLLIIGYIIIILADKRLRFTKRLMPTMQKIIEEEVQGE